MNMRFLIPAIIAAALILGVAACSSPQERSGHNPKPFNSPASWETNPYGDAFRN